MDHETTQDLLSAYLDGDLSPEERDQVSLHLEGCAECREELALLVTTLAALHDLPELEAPSGFTDQVLAKLEQAPAGSGDPVAEQTKVVSLSSRTRESRRRSSRVWLPVTLAVAACVVVGLWLGIGRLMTPPLPAADSVMASRDEVAGQQPYRSVDEREKEMGGERADDGIVDGHSEDIPEEVVPAEESFARLEVDGTVAAGPARDQAGWGDSAKSGGVRRGAGLLSEGSGSTTGGSALGGLQGGAGGKGLASGKTKDGSYYADWEHKESNGDGLAEEPSAPDAGRDKDVEAEPTVDTVASLDAQLDSFEESESPRGREAERLYKEDQAFVQLYGDDEDALTDMDLNDDTSAFGSTGEALSSRYDRGEDEEDSYDGDVADAEAVELSQPRSVSKKSSPGAGRASTRDRSRGSRADSLERDERRNSKAKKESSEQEQAAAALSETDEYSPADDGSAGPRSAARSPADRSPADRSPASGAPAPNTSTPAAPTAGSAEWSLQTTNAGTPYQVATLCASEGITCRWISPASKAQSLDALGNYQIVELEVAMADYESVKSRIRPLGNLLVRTEDVAMLGAGGPVVIRLVIEYLP